MHKLIENFSHKQDEFLLIEVHELKCYIYFIAPVPRFFSRSDIFLNVAGLSTLFLSFFSFLFYFLPSL